MNIQVNNESRHDAIIEKVIEIFIDVIGFLSDDEKKQVNKDTDLIKDFDVSGDDATEVIMALEKHFSINGSQEEWGGISTIDETASLIIKHLDNLSGK